LQKLQDGVANRLEGQWEHAVEYINKRQDRGPGLRWGIMGNMMLNHLCGGQGGIEHFFQQFTGPMTAWWKVFAS
jgi:hypothetical protein